MYVNSAKIIAGNLTLLSLFQAFLFLASLVRDNAAEKPLLVQTLFQFKYIPYNCILHLNIELKELICVCFTSALMRLHITWDFYPFKPNVGHNIMYRSLQITQ